MHVKLIASALALSATGALAASQYGQCGGIGFTGDATCPAGWTCNHQNDYYWQCLPGSSTSTAKTTTTTAKTTTTTAKTTTGKVTTTTTTVRPTTTTVATTTKPATTTTTTTTTRATTTTAPSSGGSLPAVDLAGGSPFDGNVAWFVQPDYASSVTTGASSITDSTLKAKALKVANVPVFWWMDTIAKAQRLPSILDAATAQAKSTSSQVLVQLVVYDLPDRDCAALASNGELSTANDGLNKYKTQYIDYIASTIAKYPHLRFAIVVEPDSLANMVTNLSVTKCANAKNTYISGITYAIQKLQFKNVGLYLDAGHAGWIGWPTNQAGAVTLFQSLLQGAAPATVRGFVTNVSNYNPLRSATIDPLTQGNPAYDEEQFILSFGPALKNAGIDAHFIVDQGRSGVSPIPGRQALGDWCNVANAGFGTRPSSATSATLGISRLDAVVWVKPGGECDGTSDTSSARYDSHCGMSDALQPAPEAGTWFEAYFEMLVKNANPAF
ncbi:hypothetical protein HDV00_007497 [Rhizophlyctis rosea]|nr:hypothetical protein HDV00_007497 [Rhizophlyctis rosea]